MCCFGLIQLCYPDVAVRFTCGGENAPDDATQPHQELPQGHVLLANRHHQGAGVVLDEDAGDAVTSCRVVDDPLLRDRQTDRRVSHLPFFSFSLSTSPLLFVFVFDTHPLCHRELVCVG